MTLDTIYLGIDKGSRNLNVTLLARCGYMVVHLGESMMRSHDSLAGSKCLLSNLIRNNFFWQGVAYTGQRSSNVRNALNL